MPGQVRMKACCALLSTLLLTWCGARAPQVQAADTQIAPTLFEAAPENTMRDLNRAQKKRLGSLARVHVAKVQLGVLAANERLNLTAFGWKGVAVRSELQQDAAGVLWQGAIQGDKYSSVTLSERKGQIRGTIYSEGGNFIVTPLQDNAAGLIAARAGDKVLVALGEEEPPVNQSGKSDAIIPPLSALQGRSGIQSRATEFDSNRIDIMMVYDRSAAAANPDIAGQLQLVIDDANQRFANSGLATRLRLVHTQMVEYDGAGDIGVDLGRLRDPSDGFLDEVQGLRDLYAADQVTLVSGAGDPNFGGIAYLMGQGLVGPQFSEAAYGVLADSALLYSFTHELGHNLGSAHDHVTDPNGQPAFPYSFGYTVPEKGFFTIMSYSTACVNANQACRRIPLYSNPDLSFNAVPIGSPEGAADAADNRKTFMATTSIVANFRQSRATISAQDFSAPEGNTGTNTFSIQIQRSQPLGNALSVPYRFEPDTATAGDDYDATPGMVNFLPDQEFATINIPIVADSKSERDETFTLVIGGDDNAQIEGQQRITITILNDDQPQISINDARVIEGDTVDTPKLPFLIFDLQLDGPFDQPITVDYRTVPGTASANDFTAQNGTVTFEAGQTMAAITITVTPDTNVEADETLTVQLSNPVHAALGNTSATGTIINDDLPGLRAEEIKVREGGIASFKVRLLQPSASTVKVRYLTGNGTAASPIDYNATSGVLTFAPGQTTQQVLVQTNEDNLFEDDETFFLRFDGVLGATVQTPVVRATIIDNEQKSVVQVGDARVVEGNSGQTILNFPVRLSDASPVAIAFRYETQNGTAMAGSDYVATSGIFRLAAGQTTGRIQVRVNGDIQIESNESFRLLLSTPNSVRLSKEFATGIILTDDIDTTPPRVTLSDITSNQAFKAFPTFTGTAQDERGLAGVVLQLQRISDGAVFNGTAFVRPQLGITLATTLQRIGTLPSGIGEAALFTISDPLPTGAQAQEGEYLVLATAGDNSGLRGEARAKFIIDRTPPELSIIAPANRRVLQSLSTIAGRVSDEVAGVESVDVVLQRNSDGAYFNGAQFVSARTLLPTRIQNTTWILATPLPRFTDGIYAITAIATDRAGNTTEVTNVVTFSGANSSGT